MIGFKYSVYPIVSMPQSTSNTKSSSVETGKLKPEKMLDQVNSYIRSEIAELAALYNIESSVLERFALLVINNYKKKDPVIKPLSLPKMKLAIYQHFSVKNTTELKKSGAFKMGTDGMDDLKLTVKEGWEKLYRKFIGILPGEENQKGYGCINGINIFNYFKPWQVFGLDSSVASGQDIKNAYYNLSKIYHPDVPMTGDVAVFDRITTMYKSISAEA
jgi:hypothetical protein